MKRLRVEVSKVRVENNLTQCISECLCRVGPIFFYFRVQFFKKFQNVGAKV